MYRDLISKISQAVVKISCHDINKKGSGFLISPNGHIVTNNHVVTELKLSQGTLAFSYSTDIVVTVNGMELSATVMNDTNEFPPIVYDYAILKVEGVKELPFFDIGDPATVMQGDNIVCLGFPLDFNEVIVTDGIVSAIHSRPSHINSLHQLRTFVTNAIIHFGSSGGPMVHCDSEKVIGINTLRHELNDILVSRLSSWSQSPGATEFPLIKDLINYSLKYTFIGFHHAISIEHVATDSEMSKLTGGQT